ncbi:MAG: arylesterase [Lentisphaeraceae bacterium]|nr:arylesterase [Lentisphaeraceae bacterium]
MMKLLLVQFFLCFSLLAETQTVLCLGDSLTAGYGLQKSEAYPAVLANELTKVGKFEVINAGINGNTSAGGLRRLDWYFKKNVDFLVLALGANDGLRGLDTKATKENLQKIIDKAKKKNPKIKILLAGMKLPPNMGVDYSKSFEAIFSELDSENDIYLIPFLLKDVAGLKSKNLPDGIHPNAEGQKQLAQNVLEVLKPLLK